VSRGTSNAAILLHAIWPRRREIDGWIFDRRTRLFLHNILRFWLKAALLKADYFWLHSKQHCLTL
jgi:hypothetical protein